MVDELHPQHQQHTLAGALLVEDDSSCLLVRVTVMFIVTSGDGVIGTLFDQLVGISGVWIVDTSEATASSMLSLTDTNAQHEYLVKERGVAESVILYRRRLSGSEGGGDQQ